MNPITKNSLFYGDNLKILREYIPDESADLIYLDPPFNSNRNYDVLFKDESGQDSEAQITAFEDTWHWDRKAQETYHELIADAPAHVGKMVSALKDFIGANQMTGYLVMMTVRLMELHRVLKSTGSLYLHCDPTMSHYLKIVLDTIFGKENFRNEIVWCYRKWNVRQPQFPSNHDILLFYTKTRTNFFHTLFLPKSPKSSGKGKKIQSVMGENGKRKSVYLDTDSEGTPVPDWWEIPILNPMASERLGYPTQKPLALLERILQSSSREGDTVLDPFCGCGTSIHAAEKLNRKWLGIDITHLSTSLLKYRLKDAFDLTERKDYDIVGEPEDLAGAERLAQENRYQFQWWALSLIQAKPVGGVKKKGKDRGIDGVVNFIDDSSEKAKRIIVQVKSGKAGAKDIRDLIGTAENENAQMGIFITLNEPTKDMKTSAAQAGFYHSTGWSRNYPKIQIMTIEDLMNGKKPDLPPVKRTFKQTKKDIREQDRWKQNVMDRFETDGGYLQ
ncbi:MAG: DNA methyltransferase [Desulfobacterales bacterium]